MKNNYRTLVTFTLVILLMGLLGNQSLKAQNSLKSLADFHIRGKAAVPANGVKDLNNNAGELATTVKIKKGMYRLGNLINIIASQAHLKPSFSRQFVPVNKKVKMPKVKASAQKALNMALKGTSLGFKIIDGNQLVFVDKAPASQQAAQETVTGTVTDAQTDKPLVGVNILVKGTSIGAATNKKGHYSISAPSLQDTLVFSYIGYKQLTVPVKGRNSINVQLTPSTQSLNQMVVVGYGTQKRADLTSSIATVDVKQTFQSRPITSVGNALQGEVAGLSIRHFSGQIGEKPQITLRGLQGSVNGGGAHPLILVDGVEIPDLNLIDPHNIKSISVLKDAAGTAIYGNRAAFGVILITTKQGRRNEQPTVTYHGNYGFQTPTVLPTIAPSPQGAIYALKSAQRTNPSQTSFGVIGYSVDKEAIGKMYEWNKKYGGMDLGREMETPRDFEIRGGKLYFYRPWDAPKLLTRRYSPQNRQTLSISGGTDSTNYHIGLGYLNQKGAINTGIASKDYFRRYNINLAINSQINNWLDVYGKALFALKKRLSPYTIHQGYTSIWYYAYRWPRVYPYGLYKGKPFRNTLNEEKNANPADSTSNFARLNLGATAQIIPGLQFKAKISYGRENNHIHETGGTISGYNFWTGSGLDYQDNYISTNFDEVLYTSYWNKRFDARALLTYNKDVGKHSFSILGGFEPEWYEEWDQNSQKRGLLSPHNGEFSLASGDQFASGFHHHETTVGFFGRINYSFNNTYLLQLDGRYTGSSHFPANQRFGFFPAVSAGWKISEEPFMKAIKPVLSFLKIRGSYGSVGHNLSGYPYLSTLSSYASGWLISGSSSQVTFTTPQPVSPSLTWETVTTLDLGGSAKFFNDHLTVKGDWYNRLTSDMFSPGETLPATFGATPPQRNFGELRTRGFELSVGWNHAITKNFTLNLKGTLSNFHEEITKYANKEHLLPNAITRYIFVNPRGPFWNGEDPNDIWGYVTDRLFQKSDFEQNPDGTFKKDKDGHDILKPGIPDQSDLYENSNFHLRPGDVKYKDLNGDGKITHGSDTEQDPGDRRIIGNSAPHYQYGFNIGGNWKNLDFHFFFQGVGKRQLWANGPIFDAGWNPATAVYAHQMDYWTPENNETFDVNVNGNEVKIPYGGGPNAFYPRPTHNGSSARNFLPQTRYLLNMAYLRLKTVTLGYSLPVNVLSKVNIQKLRIYVTARNLLTFDHVRIPIDPETSYTQSSFPTNGVVHTNTFGREYPFHRTYSIGIDIKL
jgi:TonB-linked SusC/RagA family outer membrane protein